MQEAAGALQQQQQQLEIQRQTEAENQLKLQEVQRQQQEQSALGDLLKTKLAAASSAAAIPAVAPTTPAPDSTGQNEPDEAAADVQSSLNAPGEAPTTPTPAAPAPAAPKPATHLADAMTDALDEAVAKGVIRPQTYLNYKQELTKAQQNLILMGTEKLKQTQELHTAIGQQLQAAKNATDPEQQNGFYQAALRQAEAAGEDVKTYARTLPADPKARENMLDSLLYSNNMGTAMLQQADIKAQTDQREEQARNRAAQEAQQSRSDFAVQLANADTPAEYMTLLSEKAKADPKTAGYFPPMPADQALTSTIDPTFRNRALEAGMTANQVAEKREKERQAALVAQKEADTQSRVKLPPDIEAQYIGLGGDPAKKLDPKLVTQAITLAGKEKAATALAGRPVNTNNFGGVIPGLTAPLAADKQSLHGDDYLATLPPATAAQVKAIGEGADTMPPANSRNQSAAALREAVYQYDPEWTQQKAQARKAFGPGTPAGKNLINLNTAIVHSGALQDLAAALDNGDVTLINNASAKVAQFFGDAAPTNYEGLRQALAGEMDQALHGTSTIEGRNAILATLPVKASQGQMEGIVRTGMGALAQKANTYKEQYEAQGIKGDKVWSPILPSAQRALDSHGVTLAGVQPKQSSSIPTMPLTLTSSDVGKVYLDKNGKQLKITEVNPANPKQFKYSEVAK